MMLTHSGLDELRANLSMVRERLAAQHIIVFGSVARGEVRPDSDLDVIFVSEEFAKYRRWPGIVKTACEEGIWL